MLFSQSNSNSITSKKEKITFVTAFIGCRQQHLLAKKTTLESWMLIGEYISFVQLLEELYHSFILLINIK